MIRPNVEIFKKKIYNLLYFHFPLKCYIMCAEDNSVYTRKLLEQPEKLVQGGKPVFGTFIGSPRHLEIKGVVMPYGVLPLPTFITDLRIRTTLSYVFNLEEYICIIDVLDAKLFGHIDIGLWNKKTGRKFVYRTAIGPRNHLISRDLCHGTCFSYNHRRYVRIAWNRDKDLLSLVFNLKGDSARPEISGLFRSSLGGVGATSATAVVPHPTMRRCKATWVLSSPTAGSLSLRSKKQSVPENNSKLSGGMILKIKSTFDKLRTKTTEAYGTGVTGDGLVSFNIASSSSDAVNADSYNENFLFVDKEITPLPPVKMTFPFGIMGKWVIQDTENMIDLIFTPISDHTRKISIFILRAQKHTIYGTYSGVLKTASGKSIVLKDFPGIIRKLLIRM